MSALTAQPEAFSALVEVRLARLRARVRAAGGDPERVTIVAVTKGHGPAAVRAALEAGLHDIGENYATELLEKANGPAAPDLVSACWHFLGPVQRNKIARLAPVVSCWQGVARAEEAVAIGRRSPGTGVFIEVATTAVHGRPGCGLAEVPQLVEQARAANCHVRGLMTVAPTPDRTSPTLVPEAQFGATPPASGDRGGRAEAAFETVAELAAKLGLEELSMGMSEDLEQAVAAGTTMIRIGRALFGERDPRGPSGAAAGLQQ